MMLQKTTVIHNIQIIRSMKNEDHSLALNFNCTNFVLPSAPVPAHAAVVDALAEFTATEGEQYAEQAPFDPGERTVLNTGFKNGT